MGGIPSPGPQEVYLNDAKWKGVAAELLFAPSDDWDGSLKAAEFTQPYPCDHLHTLTTCHIFPLAILRLHGSSDAPRVPLSMLPRLSYNLLAKPNFITAVIKVRF